MVADLDAQLLQVTIDLRRHTMSITTVKPRKWYQIHWFQDYDTPVERKLIIKLDLLIVPYVFLAYWVKYIDQANISTISATIVNST